MGQIDCGRAIVPNLLCLEASSLVDLVLVIELRMHDEAQVRARWEERQRTFVECWYSDDARERLREARKTFSR